MNPSGGVGAVNAIHDAVTLANWINVLRYPNISDLDKIFKEYRTERLPVSRATFEDNQLFTKNLEKATKPSEKIMTSFVVRAALKRLPDWMWRKMAKKDVSSRPQAAFLPLVEDRFSIKAQYQPSLHKTIVISNNKLLLSKKKMF
ncbi:hypothetical protein BGZ94_000398 [Podila epigama]|nr:hypothetical protein BGZ94_000398 [Podila epigama]